MKRFMAYILLMMLFGSYLPLEPVSAQPAATQQQPGKLPKKRNRDRPENRVERLRDFVETPDLPRYNGKTQFIEGVVFPSANSGPSITMKFLAKDKPEKVLESYNDMFEQYKWTVEKNSTGGHRVGATKDKNICHVLAQKSVDKQFKSRVTLTYRIYRSSK